MKPNAIYFYMGLSKLPCGKDFDELLLSNYKFLEECHEYIQWIFPLNVASNCVDNVPVLDDEDLDIFNTYLFKNKMRQMFWLMLEFYGLDFDCNDKICEDSVWETNGFRWDKRSKNWITPKNHNYLRLTRIMSSLALCGLKPEAKALQTFLLSLEKDYGHIIGETTFKYWKEVKI